jgi:AbiJ N-terminal domain 4
MLTDIFADRYADVIIWETFEEKDGRFLVQAFRIVSEQLYPYWTDEEKERFLAKAHWQAIHDKLSMELGLQELSPRTYSWTPAFQNAVPQVGFYTFELICKHFVLAAYSGSVSADRFMKERLSFVEIAFRQRAEELEASHAKRLADAVARTVRPPPRGTIRLPGTPLKAHQAIVDRENQEFRAAVDELNTRMRRAGYELHYHNGFIQRSIDRVVEDQIEEPFWDLVADAKWKNVDLDMKEAIDRRDNGDRDPAFYAARALESTIKIISGENGWTHGGERGAHNYIDNLGSQRAGHFIEGWEVNELKTFFTDVRNPLGHGPGGEKMPTLSPEQTDWAIEFCMSWIKSLIRRMR